jgi:hypothetical protein
MLYRSLWRSGLLISVILLGLASSTVNLAAPKASKEPLDPRFHKLPPELRERLEKRMRRPQSKAAPSGRALPIKPPPAWIQQLGTPELDGAAAVAVGPQDNIYVTGSTGGTLGNKSYGSNDAWLAKYGPGRKLLWKVQLGSPDEDYSTGVAVDRQGNAYITGYTDGKLGNWQYGRGDAWIAKYSPTGRLQWIQQLGTFDLDDSYGIATDSSGNVYLTGKTYGKLGDKKYGRYYSDAWVAKYDSSSKLQWKKQLGTTSIDYPNGIATDSSGNVYLTGTTAGKLGDQEYGSSSDYDAWVAKYDRSGTLLWTKQLGTTEGDFARGIATDSSGNVYLTGFTYGKLGDQQYGRYGSDAWAAKYDSSGALQWTKQLGTTRDEFSEGIATDSSGNVYLTGSTSGKLGDQKYGRDGYDAWAAKYDSSGALQWTKQLGTTRDEFPSGIATDSSGNVYLTGSTSGKLGDQQYGGEGEFDSDAWVAKYKP